jgi:alkylation response protein AidB-like acyl-CoA dehydrogenase
MKTTTAERDEFAAGIRTFLQQNAPESEVRRLIEEPTGFDPGLWRRLVDQFELPSILIDEQRGGQGLSTAELAVALSEAGRALLAGPVLSSCGVATAALLLAESSPAVDGLLRELAGGTTVAVLADADMPDAPVTATQTDEWTLSGAKTRVLDGQLAGQFLVTASIGESVGLFAVAAEGVRITPLTVLDLTRRQVRVDLDRAPATLLDPDFALDSTLPIAAILASAELLGVCERGLELAVEYAKNREQFGVPIGSFQAIKHLLADSFASVEQMRAAVASAAEAASDAAADLDEISSVVKAYCSQAGPKVIETLIQVLGGIGYTWEHPAHLYLRRARTLSVLYGDAAAHRRRLATRFGLAVSG